MEELERAVANRLEEGDADARTPRRVYALYADHVLAPAVYMEVVHDGMEVAVIAHNLRYYQPAMRRWRVGLIEAIVLNELHELSHWAMTDEERAELDAKSRETGLPDGAWMNQPLLDVIDWLDGGETRVVDRGLAGLPRLWRRLTWGLRRAIPGMWPTNGD